ncbi:MULTISPECIES: hypothetical protein [Trichococcus]|jgi:hypothetical protein|uniref:DUF4064 domain-containing protein n=1 Tax=Trichococcus shcherbakoviae subsp. psychrophilus TaxID=2585775 RepID=A0A5C5E5U4_9LACT|nr:MULTISPECIES: hypothetical protein [Trichococcus]TNV67908.1 hypothetical protein FHK04_13570 [Trichococcus shcherbakoviae subsp. psychrophilus]TNV69585.1 hypothetical protein FHK04_08860 [Trichococcus shcherbakoviae subsp. psychrophilus]
MKRTLERNLLRGGAIWNLINGMVTILGYATWIKTSGIGALSSGMSSDINFDGSLIDSVYTIAVGYGILQLIIGVFNIIIVRRLRNNQIQKRVVVWLGGLLLFSISTMDVIGIIIYSVLFVIYQSRNKAIRLANQMSL